MEKLKGTEKLLRKIQANIKTTTGINIKIKLGEEFCLYPFKNTITFPPFLYDDEIEVDKQWCDWIQTNFQIKICPQKIYYLSFLHEIGHIFTLYNLTDEERDDPDYLTDLIEYWNTRREKIATEWAVNFIKNNPIKFNNFINKINKALTIFYKINQLDDLLEE